MISIFITNSIYLNGEDMKIFIIGFLFISIVGSLLHFTYKLSKENKFVALFSAVNESTWEHIKMALSGLYLYSIIDYFFIGDNPNYILSKVTSILTIIVLIPLIFYSYTKITKKPILVIDILSFYLTISISQLLGYIVISLNPIPNSLSIIFKCIFLIIFIFYLSATYYPPKNKLFLDPITKTYGITKKEN